jgi:RNA polymerase sigma factor (TIGR02999 family)
MSDVTRILSGIELGDPNAAEQLLPLVYDELRKVAAEKLARLKPGQTLQATALVHEAYLRLVEGARRGSSPPWDSRSHFFAAAAEAMRRIVVENARRRHSVRHGGGRRHLDRDEALSLTAPRHDLLALDEALTRLAQEQPLKAELVKLRFFAGLTMPEAAQALGVSLAMAERYWSFARSWLYAEPVDRDSAPAHEKGPED